MRLSRAAWNNVIIFSVMGFILLINVTQKSLDKAQPDASASEQFVIGENKVILTMNVDQQTTIERVGQSWQMRPERLSPQMLAQMMRSWHGATGTVVDIEIDRQTASGLLISMVLADQPNIHMFTLYLVADDLVVFNHQSGRYISLPALMFNQLVPAGLLVE